MFCIGLLPSSSSGIDSSVPVKTFAPRFDVLRPLACDAPVLRLLVACPLERPFRVREISRSASSRGFSIAAHLLFLHAALSSCSKFFITANPSFLNRSAVPFDVLCGFMNGGSMFVGQARAQGE
ncbi:hypothetical protein CYLTODRAFT_164282 [Cylindrobasidium torrendii FP15055 ss-10]|uniref:Uncharacterized protein n=1 Tax=Cylindrobasidium torrendii FP15055 ss-10 TaxID=1314674 RepID=A0A0D7BK22_9AGAR|nr:hypothetical protein CYLTODRAFT_164282 [Cylindrobasidium torrendii FP15055 ss-10]